MEGLLKYLILLSIILFVSGFNKDFWNKYCDASITDAKVTELEKCDSMVPKQIRDLSEQCLTEAKSGTTYKDFMKTYCDSKKRKEYFKCFMKKMKEFEKSRIVSEVSNNATEMNNEIKICVYKALDIKT